MNNEQFRKLVQTNSGKSDRSKDGASPGAPSHGGGSALGSRQRASIPMTPRAGLDVQSDFAKQLAARQRALHPQKKFKSSAPRGVQLATGYVDRASKRDDETDDREQRLKTLEEALKKEEIDQETYDRMRTQIAGGDLESTHLVKGLDFKLLERIRRGEDVYNSQGAKMDNQVEPEPEEEIEDEFDRLEERDVQAIAKEKEKKKGQLSTVSLAPGKKRTRDQILAELKASRQAAQAAKESALGDRFRKIGAKQEPGTRIERDKKGREVLIIIDEDGHEKRKVRKLPPGMEAENKNDLPMPDKNAAPLGMEVPEQYRKPEEPEEDDGDVDIFDDVGDDYDPLAGMDGSSSDSDEDDSEGGKEKSASAGPEADSKVAPKDAAQPTAPRNYFQNAKTGLISEEVAKAPSMSDPAIMAAIKKAAALKQKERDDEDDGSNSDGEAQKDKAQEERRKRMLARDDRDDYDMDMGFGTSRFEDEEDFEEQKIKLSKWGDDDGQEERSSKGGGSKRKRGPKKRKGDVNNAADVLRVMEERKKA
ncbi:hypothetical protein B0I35DRAFT_404022 [Stachybotrys elegans]|uniref:RED-like N-terminal domain-containing protein n=1 Tax=Stachybotrys elegans TaxID=80388 RepID=A0A8K0WWI1_9HYPO|nr:hypothetical protein B0I35DRAFT_404022 [Stachybotrys elegans]